MRISDWSSDVCSSDLLVADRIAKQGALGHVAGPALDEDRRCFLAAGRGDREGGDVSGLEPGELLDRPFNVLRPVILAVDDDHVLGAADDIEIAAGHIAHVAGVEPTVPEADRKSTRLNSSH